jgi:hypothetical protein
LRAPSSDGDTYPHAAADRDANTPTSTHEHADQYGRPRRNQHVHPSTPDNGNTDLHAELESNSARDRDADGYACSHVDRHTDLDSGAGDDSNAGRHKYADRYAGAHFD